MGGHHVIDLELDASVANGGLMDKHLAKLSDGNHHRPQPNHMSLQSASESVSTQPLTHSRGLDPMPSASSPHIAFKLSLGVQKFVANAETKKDIC